MKMKCILLLISFLSLSAFGQIEIYPPVHRDPENVRSLYVELKKAIEKNPTILVPFKENGKFGYLDYQTLEILVPPMADALSLLNTNDKTGIFGELDGYYYTFDENQNLDFAMYGPPQISEGFPNNQDWVRPADLEVKVIPKTDDFKGFTYEKDANGKIYVTSYSEKFKSQDRFYPKLTLIEIEGKVYGIGEIENSKNQENLAGIIAPDGKPLNGFDFNFNKILQLTGLKESLGTWFLVRKSDSDDHRFHLINAKGEFLSEMVLPKLDYSRNFLKTKQSVPYYEPMGELKYAINDNKIIDLYELKMVKSIPENYKIIYLDYIPLSNSNLDDFEEKRKHTMMFAVVEDENGNWFYMDFDGKKYLPK